MSVLWETVIATVCGSHQSNLCDNIVDEYNHKINVHKRK
jgi:hypothetical protein